MFNRSISIFIVMFCICSTAQVAFFGIVTNPLRLTEEELDAIFPHRLDDPDEVVPNHRIPSITSPLQLRDDDLYVSFNSYRFGEVDDKDGRVLQEAFTRVISRNAQPKV